MEDTVTRQLPRGDQARLWKPKRLEGIFLFKARFKRFSYKKHTHREFAIGVIERGVQQFHHSGKQFIAPARTMITVNPEEVHDGAAASQSGYAYRMVYIKRHKVQEMLTGRVTAAPATAYFRNPTVNDRHVADQLCLALHQLDDDHHDRLEAHTLLSQAVSVLFRRHAEGRQRPLNDHRDRRVVNRALEYIRARATENITLAEIATAVGLSPYHFLRIFKLTTGLPPHAYLMQMRVGLAKNAIEKGASLASVAYQCGFSDQSHLTRCFKSVQGLTPGQYQSAFFR